MPGNCHFQYAYIIIFILAAPRALHGYDKAEHFGTMPARAFWDDARLGLFRRSPPGLFGTMPARAYGTMPAREFWDDAR